VRQVYADNIQRPAIPHHPDASKGKSEKNALNARSNGIRTAKPVRSLSSRTSQIIITAPWVLRAVLDSAVSLMQVSRDQNMLLSDEW
jgi:hypothetical protein